MNVLRFSFVLLYALRVPGWAEGTIVDNYQTALPFSVLINCSTVSLDLVFYEK